jgi:hypothetical protein
MWLCWLTAWLHIISWTAQEITLILFLDPESPHPLSRQACDWSLSVGGGLLSQGCQWFTWFWHLLSACNSHELEVDQTWQLLPGHISQEVLFMTTPVPADGDRLELSHFGFLLGSSLMLIKVIYKQSSLLIASMIFSLTVDGCCYRAPNSSWPLKYLPVIY